MIIIHNKQEKEIIKAFRAIAGADEIAVKEKKVYELEKKISDLEIEKSRKQEDYDKRERELRHMIGLEKKRQEFEIESAKKSVAIDVREENLKADQKRFVEQLAFNTERFEKAAEHNQALLAEIIKRLPNVNVTMER